MKLACIETGLSCTSPTPEENGFLGPTPEALCMEVGNDIRLLVGIDVRDDSGDDSLSSTVSSDAELFWKFSDGG